jgi:hypothetical protein
MELDEIGEVIKIMTDAQEKRHNNRSRGQTVTRVNNLKKKWEAEKMETIIPGRKIGSDDLFVLAKTIEEYRGMLPKDDEHILERYKLKAMDELINKMLAKGIDWTINHYADKRNILVVQMKAKEDLEKMGE